MSPVPQVPARFLGGNLGSRRHALTQLSVKNRRRTWGSRRKDNFRINKNSNEGNQTNE